MLCGFQLWNHRSFVGERTPPPMPSVSSVGVPVIAIFGANVSGRSNLPQCLEFIRDAVLRSFAGWEDGGIPRQPFRLGVGYRTKPTFLETELLIDRLLYKYGFEVDDLLVR